MLRNIIIKNASQKELYNKSIDNSTVTLQRRQHGGGVLEETLKAMLKAMLKVMLKAMLEDFLFDHGLYPRERRYAVYIYIYILELRARCRVRCVLFLSDLRH